MSGLPDTTAMPLPRGVLAVVDRLGRAGFTAYLAGGCVRDRLLGIAPKDYDIATDARPDAVSGLFPHARYVGEAFGIVLVRSHGIEVEVATFRTDGPYSDGRHPDAVTFTDAEHDASRRDFTINGLFEEPRAGTVIDFVDGRADLAARRVRAIGDPAERIREDHLRMLRAVRFAARFGFAIEAGTADAIRAMAGDLRGVSRERVGHELRAMLIDVNRTVAAWEMQYLGLDASALEEPNCLAAPRLLGRMPDEVEFGTALAAWMIDRHGDDASVHEDRTRGWTAALVLSNDESQALGDALAVYRVLRSTWPGLGVARQKRLAAAPAFAAGLLLLRSRDTQAFVDVRRRVDELARSGLAPTPLVSGGDLIADGLPPGPLFRTILDAVYDAQLEGLIGSRDEALRLAREIATTL